MSKTSIFLTGATGYIGGSVLTHLLNHPNVSSFEITAFVRDPEKAKLLEEFGLKTVVGSNSDLDKLEEATSKSDVVISTADADDVPAIKAILRGLKKRHDETGVAPILIHTVSFLVLTDDAHGHYAYETIYSDLDIPLIESLAATQPHRDVDLLIVEAGEQGYARTHIILPSTIYGLAQGPLFDKGISNKHSIQVPGLIKASWDRKQGGMVREGKNLWPNVHIEELADLYIILFDAALSNPKTANGREGYYFGESDEYLFYDLAKTVAQVLVELGRGSSEEPTPFSREEIDKYFAGVSGSAYLGSNSRARAERSRSLGWRPVKRTTDLLLSVKPEVEELARSGRINSF
ncbi:hypothetical protein JAAARDRAFT_118161 [Jaapia argillacea MUCL 33604]|uniref:NAD(P)-binding domain-containing protein n=1 Tax=Jaapia argillacea MUCL 33604 TaxID=933084 RepID=A0A067QFQ1_9AGAM|nr:hypothetical protein JAAARDRAFT_118161 [Jaapia argillacea MUCL 33604]